MIENNSEEKINKYIYNKTYSLNLVGIPSNFSRVDVWSNKLLSNQD